MVTDRQMVPGGSDGAKPVIAVVSASHSETNFMKFNYRNVFETPDHS